MASNLRQTSATFGRGPDLATANKAIDAVLAEHSFDSRSKQLKKQYKTRGKEAELLGHRFKAKADRLSRFGKSASKQADANTAAAEQFGAFTKRFSARQKAFDAWTNRATIVQDGKRYINLTGADLQRYQNERDRVNIMRKKYDHDRKQVKAAQKAYEQTTKRFNRLKAQSTRMSRRYQKAQKSYIASTKRYNRHGNFVRYTPA